VADFPQETGGIGTTNAEKSLAVLPLFSTVRSTNREFFDGDLAVFHAFHGPRKEIQEWQTPWPLVDFSHGETRHIARCAVF